jgi:hypothetical protein
MSIDRISRHYLDELYQSEAREFGTTMAYSPGGILAGFRNPNAPEEIAKFAGHLWPDGTPTLRPHGDIERPVYNQIGSFSKEFNAKASTLRPDEFRKVTGWALEAAMETDAAVIEPRTFVRTEAGGRSRVEALPLVHYSVHGVKRRGDINIHVNCVRLRAGITKAGEAYSLADNRMPYRAQREWNEQFQLRVADKVERGLGWEIDMKNGRAVPRDVHPAMVAARGGRRREMEAYLDLPMFPRDRQQSFGGGPFGAEAGHRADGLDGRLALDPPHSFQQAHLLRPGPVEVSRQPRGGLDSAGLNSTVCFAAGLGPVVLDDPPVFLPRGKKPG